VQDTTSPAGCFTGGLPTQQTLPLFLEMKAVLVTGSLNAFEPEAEVAKAVPQVQFAQKAGLKG
jgi:hypothetical protein